MKLKPNWILLLALLAVTILILGNLNDGRKLVTILKQANPWLILAALTVEAIYYLFFSRLHQQALKLYQINWPLIKIIPLVFAALLVNLLVPFGPLSSAAVFSQRSDRTYSRLNFAAALFLVALLDFLGLLVFLVISLLLLFFKHELLPVEIVAVLVLILMIAALVLLLSGVGIGWLKRLPFKWLKQKLAYWQQLADELKLKKREITAALPLSLVIHLLDLAVVGLLIFAFHQSVGLTNLIVIYSLLILFIVVVPTPQGLGVVETLMPVILSSWGLEIEAATLVILTFRGFSLWLPALAGAVSSPLIFRERGGDSDD